MSEKDKQTDKQDDLPSKDLTDKNRVWPWDFKDLSDKDLMRVLSQKDVYHLQDKYLLIGSIEMTYRLINQLKDFRGDLRKYSESNQKYSNTIKWFTIVLIGIGLVQIFLIILQTIKLYYP